MAAHTIHFTLCVGRYCCCLEIQQLVQASKKCVGRKTSVGRKERLLAEHVFKHASIQRVKIIALAAACEFEEMLRTMDRAIKYISSVFPCYEQQPCVSILKHSVKWSSQY